MYEDDISRYSQFPLHDALKECNKKAALSHLINGREVNEINNRGETPISIAVKKNFLEGVSMLLYFGADISIPSKENISPLMHAVVNKNYDIQELLFEYETDFDQDGQLLHMAVAHDSPFTIKIAEKYIDEINGEYALYRCLVNRNVELFKQLWDIISRNEIFILSFTSIWIKSLYEKEFEVFKYMIESHNVEEYVSVIDTDDILPVFCEEQHGLPREDAERTIYILLCNGWVPEQEVLNYIFLKFGYSDLFRTLLHMEIDEDVTCETKCFLPYLIYYIKPRLTVHELLDRLFSGFLRCCLFGVSEIISIVNILTRYFTYQEFFQEFLRYSIEKDIEVSKEIVEKLKRRIPSLVELSRDKVRYSIAYKFNVNSSRHFYTYLKYLDVPLKLKQIVSLEVPIYI